MVFVFVLVFVLDGVPDFVRDGVGTRDLVALWDGGGERVGVLVGAAVPLAETDAELVPVPVCVLLTDDVPDDEGVPVLLGVTDCEMVPVGVPVLLTLPVPEPVPLRVRLAVLLPVALKLTAAVAVRVPLLLRLRVREGVPVLAGVPLRLVLTVRVGLLLAVLLLVAVLLGGMEPVSEGVAPGLRGGRLPLADTLAVALLVRELDGVTLRVGLWLGVWDGVLLVDALGSCASGWKGGIDTP